MGSVCVGVDVAVFEVRSRDQTVALLNNPLTRASISASLSLLFPQRSHAISHLAESMPCPQCSPCHNDKLLFSKQGTKKKFGWRLHEFMDQ